MTAWGISRDAYYELRYFCKQYAEKKATAAALAGVSAVKIDDMPRATGTSDPTGKAALKRMKLLHDCGMIEKAAKTAGGGKWYDALMLNCCYGRGYEYIDPAILPTSNRNAFFTARREFFFLLYQAKYDEM